MILRPGRFPAGAFFVLLAAYLAAPLSACASYSDAVPPLLALPQPVAPAPDFVPLPIPGLALGAPPVVPTSSFRSEFQAEYPSKPWLNDRQNRPSFVLQRGEYGGSGFKVLAEMGDLHLTETGNTLLDARGRGGRFSLLTGSAGNRATFKTFAASGALHPGPEDTLVGATGELSLLDDSALFKTIFVSGRSSLDREGRWPTAGAKRGDVVGFVARLEPVRGKLAAEAEYDYSVYDANTADPGSALRDSACRFKMTGDWGRSRYMALYERTGPRYRLMGDGPERDREGGSFGVATALELHDLDVRLSRYNDNTERDPLNPRLYRYEGVVDYKFKGFKTLPLALQYRKTFIDSTKEPVGYAPKDVAEDAVSGQANLLAGRWDLGLRGGVTQRTDRIKQQRELSTASVGFFPKFSAANFTLFPDLYMKRTNDYAADQRTDQYAVNLGVTGNLLEKRLDYEVKGGFKRESTGVGTGREVLGAKVKALYPLAGLFKWTRSPSLGIKGEFNGINNLTEDRRENDFSLLISLDGGSFL
ncbi:hypothetical protein [Geomonas terrae]|nr:hypothetical protein [Geomonas terrae]